MLDFESISFSCYLTSKPRHTHTGMKNNERGWLHLERIILAMKAAAAGEAAFDDIFMTNSEALSTQILRWSNRLRKAAVKQVENPKILIEAEKKFKNEFETKYFHHLEDREMVGKLLEELMEKFKKDWDGEVKKQKSLSSRTRDIVLRWGCFSDRYVEKSGLLSDDKIETTVHPLIVMMILRFLLQLNLLLE